MLIEIAYIPSICVSKLLSVVTIRVPKMNGLYLKDSKGQFWTFVYLTLL